MRRVPLPVLHLERPLVECTDCGRCCTYVGIGINPPTSPRHATDILWYLYHQGVYVYVDAEGEWSVHFETRCRNLGVDLRCGVYLDRPHICRSFDDRTCEVNAPARHTLTFREPAEFLAWLRERKPRLHARIEKGFVPKALRPERKEPATVARAPRRRAVARTARV
ncbi:MAG TPA: YkgJ family cysteine cluster protein [Vicinamibacteria bacterium]|nr:YkgJ family cysteine cluster protein [Vicinamibacteria bacterium]